MNFDDLSIALENLAGEISLRMIRNISSKYQSAGTYDAVARAFEDRATKEDANNVKVKAIHDSIRDQWNTLPDAERFILLKYQEQLLGDEYHGYEDVDTSIYESMLKVFGDYVSQSPNSRYDLTKQ